MRPDATAIAIRSTFARSSTSKTDKVLSMVLRSRSASACTSPGASQETSGWINHRSGRISALSSCGTVRFVEAVQVRVESAYEFYRALHFRLRHLRKGSRSVHPLRRALRLLHIVGVRTKT